MRVAKNTNYTVMNRTALNDTRLSWKAKGIMAYMLSMPDDWIFYFDELVKHSKDGKASFRAGFNELKECGYVERRPIREGQRIKEWETIVHEVPHDNSLLTDFQHVEKQKVENQEVGFQEEENRTLLSTDGNKVLNIPNTNRLLNTYNHQQESTATVVGFGILNDKHFAELLNTLEQNIGPFIPFQCETLGFIYDQYGYELTNAATKEMLLARDIHKPLAYLKRILQSWNSKGITNLHNLEHYRKRGEQHGTNYQQPAKEYSDGVNF
ncbi:DnaD domain protein [Rummeliibacillus pycnus]|uniref:DnaD domain protein n=1 Tax=Rummeliibacillus pycnus TaxID=101070 RepID=UPI001FE851DD|nr:DnaD domain protein [Rummeliibacillus pycnus]